MKTVFILELLGQAKQEGFTVDQLMQELETTDRMKVIDMLVSVDTLLEKYGNDTFSELIESYVYELHRREISKTA